MANRAKQQREKRRQSSRDARKLCTRKLLDRYFGEIARNVVVPVSTPFFDAIRSRDELACVEVGNPVFRDGPRIAEAMEIQQQLNQVVKFTTWYVSMSSSLKERDERIKGITNSAVGKLRQRLEKEMMEVSFDGDVSSYYLQKRG